MFEGTSAGDEFAGEVASPKAASTQGGIYSIEVVPDRTSKVPAYRVTTKVRVLTGDRDAPMDEDAFGGRVVANIFETYPVTRTLEELRWFRDQYWEKEPYSIVAPLPDPAKASSLKAVDQILAMLFLMSSSPRTNTDPLFWALLTAADDDFRSLVHVRTKGEKLSKAFWSAVAHYTTAQPKRELKPTTISKAMVESTMIDRAFLTVDKLNTCVESLDAFQQRSHQCHAILHAWEDAHEKLYMLRVSLDHISAAAKRIAPSLREMCDTNYWPWTKEEVFADAMTQVEAGNALHPSHRLTHYMHRAANNAAQVANAEGGVVSDEWAMGVSLCVTLWRAYEHSAVHCDAHLRETPLKSSAGSTLVQLQSAALKIIESGTGFPEAEKLERIDAEVTDIQDNIDARCVDFDTHFDEVKREIAVRALRHLKELRVAQALAWQSTQLLIDDFNKCLSDDPFVDLEDEALTMVSKEPEVAAPGSPVIPTYHSTVTTTTVNPPRGDPATEASAARPKFDARDSTLFARLFAAATPLVSARSDRGQESARTFGRRLRQQFDEEDPHRNPFDITNDEGEEMASLNSTYAGEASGSLNPDDLIARQEAMASDAMIGGSHVRRQSVPKQQRKAAKKKSWAEVYENPDKGNEFGW